MSVAEAAFVMVAENPFGLAGGNAKVIEEAMLAALKQAQAEGITDVEEIRRRVIAARDAF